jgi:hypothetical protein
MVFKSIRATRGPWVLVVVALLSAYCFGNKLPNPDLSKKSNSDTSTSVSDDAVSTKTPLTANRVTTIKLDSIAGELPSYVKAQSRPYLVVGPLDVPQDKTVTIEKGTVFVFRNFTGLHVEGKLIAMGTKQDPIVFTSENDQSVNSSTTLLPNPFDWDGVYIHANAIGTILSNCSVSYSVFGIVSETKFIKLDPVTLLYNGKTNLVIEGKEFAVSSAPYSYVLSVKDVRATGVPITLFTDPLVKKRNTLRYCGLGAFVVGSAVGGYYGSQWYKNQRDLSAMSSDDPQVLRNYPNQNVWDQTRSKRNTSMAKTWAGAIVGVLGIIGVWWSFTF